METPKNMEGYRTERIMAKIKYDVFGGEMETTLYNKIYSAVYNGLKEVSVENVSKILLDEGVLPWNRIG